MVDIRDVTDLAIYNYNYLNKSFKSFCDMNR
jgi:hypothetical protein